MNFCHSIITLFALRPYSNTLPLCLRPRGNRTEKCLIHDVYEEKFFTVSGYITEFRASFEHLRVVRICSNLLLTKISAFSLFDYMSL